MTTEEKRKHHREYMRMWRAAHPEYRKEQCVYQRAYNEVHREQRQRWLESHTAYYPESQRHYRRTHQAQRNLWNKHWRAKHPEARQLDNTRRRARLRAVECTLTTAEWRTIKAAYGHRCVYCRKKFKRLTLDHVIPISKGGPHTKENVVPACRRCNSRKYTGPAPVFQRALILGG
jgi:5-methylcytosine-specific restriction endonuclease McrA